MTSCVLADTSGKIKLTAWNDDADKLVAAVENNKTYYVSGCRVQPVRERRYNNTDHQYELVWCQNTVIQVWHC